MSERQVTNTPAREVDTQTARQIAVLLGRSFTDQRHTDRYTPDDHERLDAHVARIHAAHPRDGELMPADWLDHFPTFRNFNRQPAERREAFHFLVPCAAYYAAHVSLWPQRFLFEGQFLNGGYIEDVATDPLHLGEGHASAAMTAAAAFARRLELDILGLATGIAPFYERLGWRTWEGTHLFSVLHLEYPDEPLMLLPLTPTGEAFAAMSGAMRSRRLWHFREIPTDWP